MHADWFPFVPLIGLLAGVMVGASGVGGAAVATPLMVMGLGIPAPIAIATDAAFCAVIKLFGVAAHRKAIHRQAPKIWGIFVAASIGVLLGVFTLRELAFSGGAESLLRRAIGVTLILSAAVTTARLFGCLGSAQDRALFSPWARLLACALVGFLVGLTSIGAGSLLMPVLMASLVAPFATVVGLDLALGLLLAIVVGLAQTAVGFVDFDLFLLLVVGGTPGVLLGSHLHNFVNPRTLASTTATVVGVVGIGLLI